MSYLSCIFVSLLGLSNWNGVASAQHTFLKIYDSKETNESVNNIIETSSHDYIITGASGGPTSSSTLVMKVDENGNIIWEKRLEHPPNFEFGGLITKARGDNGYLVLGYGWRVFLHRLDEDGNVESNLIDIVAWVGLRAWT